jgi:hypothetical protein
MKLKKKGKYHNFSVSCQLDLFDKVVKPIVLYGSEVWGFRNSYGRKSSLEILQIIVESKNFTANSSLW